ncbi:MAG: hypothetical protein IPH12_14625, partial [Saprospirales bacterium]|nr:hypothetical protein [Saprospirales bacterium]
KIYLLLGAFTLLTGAAVAQKSIIYTQSNQKVDTVFPYNIPLLDIDSTVEMNSREVLAA